MTNGIAAAEGLIDLHCKELRLPGLRQGYRELAREALDRGVSPLDFLLRCLEEEQASRRRHRLQSRLRAAKFPAIKTLDGFDFSLIPSVPKAKVWHLAAGQFIRQKENLLCVGPSGTGKTHVAIALGLAAIEAGFRVRFIRMVTLAQELLLAQQEVRLNRYLKAWRAVDLAICDEFGYLELGDGAPLVFQFVSDRYEQGSILVTSNLEFSRWGEVMGDVALTTALLDRLTHRAHVLLFQGESHRFRESRRRLQDPPTPLHTLSTPGPQDENDPT